MRRWSEVKRKIQSVEWTIAGLARKAGISESTIHKGVKHNTSLRPSTAKVIGDAFAEHAREEALAEAQDAQERAA
ncbi:hypothetical protein D5400_11625 [Georhizobium profundi]|uniref:XRE family transcriptional regulator n=1 Tax=Georhizobium profundi TaxID=2341112 RepID=A0A3S9B4F3_9HYPH|nr:hypothetical protein [Georhizobium profundi]AZN71838.1 hypothetical protein D5400_11625 [Georhizobium profundi]